MLNEEVAKYRELSGDTNSNVPISRIGGYLDGYEKALEQESCEDTISRSDMLDAIGHGTTYTSEEIQRIIKGLPPVTPQPKTGHWILTNDDDYEYCTCSECGYQNGENWMIGSQIKFCQECGAKMQESEDLGDYPDTIHNQFDNMTGSMNL